jgi:hypothetical protein
MFFTIEEIEKILELRNRFGDWKVTVASATSVEWGSIHVEECWNQLECVVYLWKLKRFVHGSV